MRPFVILVWLILLAAPSGLANNWTQFRYNETHQGTVPDADNKVFKPFLEKWWNNVSLPGTPASPVVRDGIVYVGDSTGTLYAFDQESGGLIWKNVTTAGSRILGAPAVGEDFAYVINEGGNIYSFNRKNGNLQNGYPISAGASVGSLMLHEDILYVGSTDGSVRSYFASTRQARFTFSTVGTFFGQNLTCTAGSIDGTPVLFEQWVFVGSTNHCFFAIRKSDPGTITSPIWGFKAGESIRSSPVIDRTNRRVIFGDVNGAVYAIPVASTGLVQTAAATYTEPAGAVTTEMFASPAVVGDKLIVASRNGNVRALALSSLAPQWGRYLNGEITSSPAAANAYVLIGSFDGHAYLLHASNGTEAQNQRATREIEVSPAISGTQGFWASKDGTLYSYGGKRPDRPDLAVVTVAASLTAGQSGTVLAQVKNQGKLNSTAAQVQFYTGAALIGLVDLPALAVGAQTELSVSYTAAAAGALPIRVVVDPSFQIKESDKSNNVFTTSVTVNEPPSTDTTTATEEPGIPGPGGVSLLAALGAALALARFPARKR